MWSFITAQKSDALNYANFDISGAAVFSQHHRLQYYTPQMHFAAFALPPFVRDMMT
jgi:spermidine synthase